MANHPVNDQHILDRVRPLTDQHLKEIQPYETIVKHPIARGERVQSCLAAARILPCNSSGCSTRMR